MGNVMAHIEFDAVLNRFVLRGGQATGLPTTLDPKGIDYGKPVRDTVMGNMAIQEDYARFVPDKKVSR
jgi:hypothetical protein